MFPFSKPASMPRPGETLPGRPNPILNPRPHTVLGTADRRAVSRRLRDRRVRARLLLGRGEDVLAAAGRMDHRGRLPGRLHAESHVPGGVHGPDRPRRGGARRVRPIEDQLRAAAQGVLGEPRPDAGHAPGQRLGHPVPVGDLRPGPTPSAPPPRRRRRCTRPSSARPATARSRPRSSGRRRPTFYFAEDYHQQYLDKNRGPGAYCPDHRTGVKLPDDFVVTPLQYVD